MSDIWISPHQMAFMYQECPRCTWLHHHNYKRPSGDFSSYNAFDSEQKKALPVGTSLHSLGIKGRVYLHNGKVCSVSYGSAENPARIFGYMDILAELDECGYAILDLKTGRFSEDKADRYRRQLSGYALGLTEPDRHQPMDIRKAYLIFCTPTIASFVDEPPTLITQWNMDAHEVSLDLEEVRGIVRSLVDMIENPEPPASGEQCMHCKHARRLMSLAKRDGEPAEQSKEMKR